MKHYDKLEFSSMPLFGTNLVQYYLEHHFEQTNCSARAVYFRNFQFEVVFCSVKVLMLKKQG